MSPKTSRAAGCAVAALLAALILGGPAAAGSTSPPPAPPPALTGLSLTEALLVLQERGLRIAFTSEVVRPEMRVLREPTASTLPEILDQLLRPHGLEARPAPGGLLVVVPAPRPAAGEEQQEEVGPGRLPIALDQIVVTPSQTTLLASEPVAALTLGRDEVEALPHLGNDLFRAASFLPGISGNELAAPFSVRGGRPDEVLVMLDRLELVEPFHLRDFNDALSIVAPRAVAEVELILGGFPAEYGDRLSGVLDMRTGVPDSELRRHLGVGILELRGSASAGFRGGRGRWLAVARSGSLELASAYLGREEQPRFWDLFAKTDLELGPGRSIGLRLLHAADTLDFDVVEDGDREQAFTDYDSSYLWLTHQALPGAKVVVASVLSAGEVDRDRRGGEQKADGQTSSLRDERSFDVFALRQDWQFQAGARHLLKWGFDLRRSRTAVDYDNVRDLEDPLAAIRFEPRSGSRQIEARRRADRGSLYLADRLRPWRPLTLELGLRYDRHQRAGDRDLSPRFNLVYALGDAGTLRLAWGRFVQGHRLEELHVEDGETELAPSERSEEVVVGFERFFAGGTDLRLNLYHRDIHRPRRRWENVFEPVSPFAELEPDRVRIDPERAAARGLELFLRGHVGSRVDWWASWVWSRVEDEIEGRWVPRGIDQPHSLRLHVGYRPNARWSLALAWRYHTGWPTTTVSGRLEENDEGELEPVAVFGPSNGERLPDYHRLDLRVSRRWQWAKRSLTVFVDLQNLYDRENVAGFDADLELEVRPDGRVEVIAGVETWGGFLPSFGIDLEF